MLPARPQWQMPLSFQLLCEVRVRNLKFATSKTLVNFMKKMMFLSKNWYFSVQKALIYYTVNKSHHNSFIILVFSHVANFRYVANFRFLTLTMDHTFSYCSKKFLCTCLHSSAYAHSEVVRDGNFKHLKASMGGSRIGTVGHLLANLQTGHWRLSKDRDISPITN